MTRNKVILLGNTGVGKTSIIQFAVKHAPHLASAHTIGCNCSQLDVAMDGMSVSLNVWDTAGQELYRSIVPIYARDSEAAIVVYDISDEKSFLAVGSWVELLAQAEANAAIYITANKIDLERIDGGRAVQDERAGLYAEGIGAKFFRVSALDGTGISELFAHVAADLIAAGPKRPAPMPIGASRSTERHCC
jgi:small GTP-binding protein